VLRINPKRQVPVLIDGDLEIFDSTQIFEYFETVRPEPALWPAAPVARARARLLEHKSDEVYFPPIVRLMGLQDRPDDPAAVEARADALAFYDEMERTIGGRNWLADGYSYADIAFYMAQLFGARMGAPMDDRHPRLLAWRDRMSTRPAVARVAGAMGRYLLSQGRQLPPFLAKLSA
jgi:glutathione S-transferase